MQKHYDIAVIGAGSAGLVAATSAKRAGLSVALLEKNKIGGECLHTGCVPSKTFINSAKVYATAKKTNSFGLPSFVEKDKLDFSKVMEHVNSVVQHIYKDENPEVFQKIGIDVYVDQSGAQFVNSKEIKIGNEIITAEHTIICTGSSPKRIETVDGSYFKFFDNENFWEIRKQPKNILFIGGGIISAEIGQSLKYFGSKVTIIDHNERILKVVDKDITDVLIKKFNEDGIKMIPNAEVESFEKKGDSIIARIKTTEHEILIMEFDSVFLTAGRIPNTKGMNLENAGIDYDSRWIKTNEYFQTTAENIYACGDVSSKFKFTHAASYQADICLNNILNGNSKKMNVNLVPWAIFTDPEIAHTGLSESESNKLFPNINIFKVDAAIDRFIAEGKTEGFLKLIFDDKNNIVGADAIGASAGEWIQIITVAIKNKISIESIADTIFIYPTFAEIVKKSFTRFQRSLKQQ
ncbi:MAG: NAD(P)/FAD-dependent oxidoreductase [Ignavibacteriales bacterium]|nr:NAD(P)/FAD-dependent oxidoreductase [Ignavibacteriales bacterium]